MNKIKFYEFSKDKSAKIKRKKKIYPGNYLPVIYVFILFIYKGEDPFGEIIDTINGKTIRLSKVRIRYIISIEELQKISDCKILYIGQSEKKNIPRILYKINRQPIVTITEHANTAQSGVIINFIVKRVNGSQN